MAWAVQNYRGILLSLVIALGASYAGGHVPLMGGAWIIVAVTSVLVQRLGGRW